MCGIFGMYRRREAIDLREIVMLRDRLWHRGPDDGNTWISPRGNLGLAHRRLSILDLSPAGRQPMESTDGRYAIVFNGEVYNYLELRAELAARGHHFVGSGDTEVVLAAYAEWGESCLVRFNGMFALAVYDRGGANIPASLFLARDRAGKKPLYIAHDPRGLAFASELKAIPVAMRGGLDLDALNHYLALGYIPDDLCIAAGVRKLPPAHAARYFLESGDYRVWRWWSLPELAPASPVDPEALAGEAENLLHDAVKLRLRSDVPVGVLLSGGLDSSLVVASAAHASSQRVKTFTISFPGSRLDESGYAAIVARHFDTEHHVLSLPEPSLSALDELAPLIDEPIADSSILPAYLVSRLTVGHVKVALGGDGGDELFGGYSDYTQALADAPVLRFVPGPALSAVAQMAGRLPIGIRGRNRLYSLRGGAYQALVWGSPYFDAPARRRLLHPEVVDALGDRFMAPEMFRLSLFNTGRDPVDAMTRTHFGSILPDDFLVKVDRASMAVGLEMRCPFLDVRLIEFAFGCLPSEWKVLGSEGRRLQKLLAKRMLPPALDVNRKQGFSIPLDSWLRAPGREWLSASALTFPGVLNLAAIHGLVSGLNSGRANGSRLFALLMLGLSRRNLEKRWGEA